MTNSTKKAPSPADQRIGQRIRWQRTILGLSQDKLGEALDLTFQQIQKYEKGVNRVSASRLGDIARILQVPVGFFYDEEPGAQAMPALVPDTPEGLALLQAFHAISHPELRRQALILVQTIAAIKM